VIPWKIISANLKSLEPFNPLLGPNGAHGDHVFLQSYTGLAGVLAPIFALNRRHWLVAIGSLLEYGSALVSPLALESITPGLIGSCPDASAQGCAAVAKVSYPAARALQVLLALL